EAVATLAELLHNAFDARTIQLFHAPAARISEHALGECAGEIDLVLDEPFLQPRYILKGFAAGEFTRGVNGGAVLVLAAPRSDRIEVLQCEPGWIDLGMATHASRALAMLAENL